MTASFTFLSAPVETGMRTALFLVENPGRRPRGDGVIRDVFQDHRAGADDGMAAYLYSLPHHRTDADEGALPDGHPAGEGAPRGDVDVLFDLAFVVDYRPGIDNHVIGDIYPGAYDGAHGDGHAVAQLHAGGDRSRGMHGVDKLEPHFNKLLEMGRPYIIHADGDDGVPGPVFQQPREHRMVTEDRYALDALGAAPPHVIDKGD